MAHYSAPGFCIPLESGFVAQIYRAVQRRFIFIPAWRIFLSGPSAAYTGFRACFPSGRGMVHNLIVGLFPAELFLGGCFYAIHRGMPSGIVALITGLQPVLTAILVSLHAPSVLHPRKWLGIAIGFCGRFPRVSRQASIVLH